MFNKRTEAAIVLLTLLSTSACLVWQCGGSSEGHGSVEDGFGGRTLVPRGTLVPLAGSEAKASRGLKPARHAVFILFGGPQGHARYFK